MKKLMFIMLLMAALPAMSQYTGFYKQEGKVIDAETGKPLQGATVTNHRSRVQTDEEGHYTIDYHTYDSDLRIFVSHQGYITDTFGCAPNLIRLRPLQKKSIQNSQVAKTPKKRPTVAVVLSGGGAKGVAHIAALRAIEEAGIPIDIVCGTSMGSLVGGLYCIGYSTDYLDSLVRTQDWTELLSDRTDPAELTLRQRQEQNTYALIRGLNLNALYRKNNLNSDNSVPQQGGLIRGRNLNRLFRRLCAQYLDSISFDSLPIRFACVATDLVTNNEVDFHSGYLIQAMRASMSIPGVFTPVRMGNSVLVDGGLSNNYPADLARRMGADIIIGVTVQGDPLTANDIRDATTVLSQIIDINTKRKYDDNVELSDIFMKVDVHGYSAASFTSSAIDTLLRRGAEEAALHRDDLLALSARIKGSTHTDTTQRPSSANSADIGYTHTPASTTKAAPTTRPQPTRHVASNPIASVGFRFDTEEMGALIVGVKLPIHTFIPMGIGATLRLGKQLVASVEHTFLPRSFTSPTLSYTFGRHDLDVYSHGERRYNVKYRRHTADFSPYNFRIKNLSMQAGLQWDYFNFYGQLLSSMSDSIHLTDNHYFAYHATVDLNTENHWYFPSQGTRLHLAMAYRTDNLVGYRDGIGITDINSHWRVNLTPLPNLTVQPMLYGRFVLCDREIPTPYINAIGGEWFAHNLDQLMPFAGIGNVEYVERLLVAAQLQLQLHIMKNHYILMRAATAIHSDQFNGLFSVPSIVGAQLGYSYHTFFGPIDLRLGYSNHTREAYFFINLGHRF